MAFEFTRPRTTRFPLGAEYVNICAPGTCPAIAIGPTSISSAVSDVFYRQRFSADNGAGPYMFSVEYGTIPPGMSLSLSGELSGTPTVTGTYRFAITAKDVAGCAGTQEITLLVAEDWPGGSGGACDPVDDEDWGVLPELVTCPPEDMGSVEDGVTESEDYGVLV